MARYWLVAVIIGVILTLGGAQGVWLGLNSRTQLEMSLEEFLETRPDARWVKLTDCRVDYSGMVYKETIRRSTTTLSDVSVPVFPDSDRHQPVSVVLCVADRREKDVVKNFRTMGMPRETIEGVIRGGPLYSGMSKKLQDLAPWKLAENYVIIDEGRKPDMRVSALMLGIGALLLGWMTMIVARRFNRPRVPPMPTG